VYFITFDGMKLLVLSCTLSAILISISSCNQPEKTEATAENNQPSQAISAISLKEDSLSTSNSTDTADIFPSKVYGFYKSYTPESTLLDEKGQPLLNNNHPVIVPPTLNYIQLDKGKVYGIQVSNRQRFLFTGYYELKPGSSKKNGTVILVLDGKSMKNGQSLGRWLPEVVYTQNTTGEYSFILKGTAGAEDAEMVYLFKDKSSRELLELIDRESQSL
jgi:hypothetical protein